MSQRSSKTPRELALEQVGEHEETVARWSAEKAAREQELESLQGRAGEEVLANPESAGDLTRSMQELRDRIDIAGRALGAAQPKLEAARRAAVLAEADEWDVEAGTRRKVLETHVARTRELLNQLREHDGVEYAEAAESRPVGEAGPRTILRSVRAKLHDEVKRAELTAHVLREVAAGRDPRQELTARGSITNSHVLGKPARDYYPPSIWGPDAVLPAPAYVATLG